MRSVIQDWAKTASTAQILDDRCAWCRGTIDGRLESASLISEMVALFCYVGDMLSIGRSCELAVSTHVKKARKAFRELLPG